MKYKKRRHDEKVAAVRMVVEGGMTVTEAARRTDNSPATITAWLRDDDINPDKEYARLRRERIKPKPIDPSPQGVGAVARTNPEELVAENRNLRRKIAYLEDKVAYLESLFNTVLKKPWEIPKKKIRGNQGTCRRRKAEHQTAVLDSRGLTEMLLRACEGSISQGVRGCGPDLRDHIVAG